MMALFLLILCSIGIVLVAEFYHTTRNIMQKLTRVHAHGACHSFFFDIPFLLPLVGLLVEVAARHKQKTRQMLYVVAVVIFLAISGSLYLDYLNLSFMTPFLGHPEAWGGNHFMWNSGMEVIGWRPWVDTTVPTYKNIFGFWFWLGLIFFALYPLIMIKSGTWLHGLFFGYTKKQTGISALFFESRKK